MTSTRWDSRRFQKQVPASAMGPSFKLSLPYDVVTRHLSHLVGRDFELAASAGTEQCWTAQVLPRRNKDRSEFTLKGWRLFAEAHGVQVGDTLSFELVAPQRLVIKKVKDPQHLPDALCSLPNIRVTTEPAAPTPAPAPAPASIGTAPDVKPFETFESFPAASEPKLLERIIEDPEEMMPSSPVAGSQGWNCMDDWLAQASVATSGASQAEEDDQPHAGLLMAVDEPQGLNSASSWPGIPEFGRHESGLSTQTVDRRKSVDITRPTAPSTPTGSKPHLLRADPWSTPLQASTLIPVNGHSAAPPQQHTASHHHFSGSWPGSNLHPMSSGSTTRSLQNDVKRFELRAERAEREEVQLRLLLNSLREELAKCLHALGGLERNVHAMTYENTDLRGETLRHCHAIKTALWRVTSTDI